jgi:hypothetical protein
MMMNRCAHEKELAEALARGNWPAACAPELRAHVDACRNCADLALVTEAFQRARAETVSAARIGPAGALWWRAQLRRRNAAVERIGKPVQAALVFALAVNLLVLVGLLATQARQGLAWLTCIEGLPRMSSLHLERVLPATLFTSGWSLLVLIPALAALALLSGVAIYLASESK